MSGEPPFLYDPSTGTPFYIPVPYDQAAIGYLPAIPSAPVPPYHPHSRSPSSPVPAPPGPEWVQIPTPAPQPAPLGSLQNPYPPGTVPLRPILRPGINSTQHPHTYSLGGQTQMYRAEPPIQQYPSTPLLHRCYTPPVGDAGILHQQPKTASEREYVQAQDSWLANPPLNTKMGMGQEQNQPAKTTIPWPASTSTSASAAAAPPPPPPPPGHSYPPQTCTHCHHLLQPRPLPVTTPSPHPPPQRLPQRSITPSDFLPAGASAGDGETEPTFRKWEDCQICNCKPATRDREGVLFCERCLGEAVGAEAERERERVGRMGR